MEAIEYGGTAVGSAEFSRGGGRGGDGRRADARGAAAAEHSAHHDRPAAVGDHRRTVGLPHAEHRPAGARGDAVRAELHAVGGVLSGARHAAERRLSLAQRRVQPGALAALGASRHEPRCGALLAATARSGLPAGLRRQVARQLPAHAARFRFSRSGGDQRLRSRAAAKAGSESGPRAALHGTVEGDQRTHDALAGVGAFRDVGLSRGSGGGHAGVAQCGTGVAHDGAVRQGRDSRGIWRCISWSRTIRTCR